MRQRFLIPVVVAALLAACGDDSKPASSPPTSKASPSTTAASRDAAAGVTLQDPGASPRQVLALRLRAGDVARRAMVTNFAVTLTVQGKPAPVGTLPGTRIVLEQRVDRVDANGDAHVTGVFADMGVVPTPGVARELTDQMAASLAQLKGTRLTGVIGANGAARGLSLDTSRMADPTLKQVLDSLSSQIGDLSAPFPAEPVGRGARWAVRKRASLIGLSVDTTINYTLRERTGDRYALDYTQVFTAVPGAVTLPGVPAGADIRVERFDMRGNGNQTSLVTQALPTTSTGTATGDATFAFTDESERGTLTEHITAQVALTPA